MDDRSYVPLPPPNDKGVSFLPSVDYLTCTTKESHVYDVWWRMLQRNTRSWFTDNGSGPVEAHWKMYQGLNYGRHIFIGQSKLQGGLLKASGQWANVLWPLVTPSARRVSRIDLAVTIELERPNKHVARDVYEGDPLGRVQFSFVQNSLGGSTAYIGSMHSDQSGRVYDKGVQAGLADPGKLWRYEVMLRDLKSLAIAKGLYETWRVDGPVGDQIRDYVWAWFKLRGVSPVFGATAIGGDIPITDLRIDTVSQRLAWLRTSVQPAIKRLIAEGLQSDLEDALGYSLTPRGARALRVDPMSDDVPVKSN